MSKNSTQKKKQQKVMQHPVEAELLRQNPEESDAGTLSHNISRGERIASGVMGSGLLVFGLSHFLTLRGQASNLGGILLITRGVTGHCPVYQALGIDSSPQGRMHHLGITDPHPIQFRQSISTPRTPAEVFEFCRDQSQVSRCFPLVKQVQKIDNRRSTWVFSDRSGVVQFPVTVEITQESDHNTLAWIAFPDSKFRVTGSLQFKHGPHNKGTELVATVHIVPPAGLMGSKLMKWLSPINNDNISEILHKLKQVLETGEITTGQDHVLPDVKEDEPGWSNRVKSRIQLRTLQSLVNRRLT